jgi:hypothetical protein
VKHGAEKVSIDLGLALLSVLREPGERLTLDDIAAWCECDRSRIAQIEFRALRKVRRRIEVDAAAADKDCEWAAVVRDLRRVNGRSA